MNQKTLEEKNKRIKTYNFNTTSKHRICSIKSSENKSLKALVLFIIKKIKIYLEK